MSDSASGWPEIPVAEWADTRDTLQLMTQVVGKVRMENTPLMSHWWNVVLYVSARGLTTGPIPDGAAGSAPFPAGARECDGRAAAGR